MTTPLHAALGETGSELTFALVEKAAEQRIAETDQLDWKSVLHLSPPSAPADDDNALKLELAKDIAAMANTRGGLLICGVKEKPTGPHQIRDLGDLTDDVEIDKIRTVAYNHIHPPVPVTFTTLTSAEGPHAGATVLVIHIPESEDAPHLIHPKRAGDTQGWMIAPVRAGSKTRNMTEKELEGAYRLRLEGRRARDRELRELLAELVERRVPPAKSQDAVVVAVARPNNPRRGPLPGREPRRIASNIIDTGRWLAGEITHIHDHRHHGFDPITWLPVALLARLPEPRRGLRRHTFAVTTQAPEGPVEGQRTGSGPQVSVDLHDDGTIGFTWRRGGQYSFDHEEAQVPTPPSLATGDVNAVAIALVALIRAVKEELAVDSDYQLTIGIWPRQPINMHKLNGDTDRPPAPAPPLLEAELRFTGSPDVLAADILTFGQDMCSLVEDDDSTFERFWHGLAGSRSDPTRELARRLFGGEPPHPVTGQPM